MEEILKDVTEQFDTTQFLDSILEKSTVLSSRIDDQLNILLGLGTAIFIFSAAKMNWTADLWWVILGCFSAISTIVGLFAIHPPRFVTQVGQHESVMYNKNITGKFRNSQEYGEKLIEVISSKREVVHQYATEIYNVYKYYYGPKRRLFKLARLVLAMGIALALILFLADKLF